MKNVSLNLKENINNRWKCSTCKGNIKYSVMSRSCTEIVVGDDAGEGDWILIRKNLNALLVSVDSIV